LIGFRAAAVIAVLCCGALLQTASAQSGPFAAFPGRWSGSGTIRVTSADKQTTERLRCSATYRVPGSRNLNLQLGCKSDSYTIDLTGDFEVDASAHISGHWTEHSRNVGGTTNGTAQGDKLHLYIESSAFAATLDMTTRSRQQSVSLDSRGAGQTITASVTLRRN
jgi:hypothetical protein